MLVLVGLLYQAHCHLHSKDSCDGLDQADLGDIPLLDRFLGVLEEPLNQGLVLNHKHVDPPIHHRGVAVLLLREVHKGTR